MARRTLVPGSCPPGDGRHAAGEGVRSRDQEIRDREPNGVIELPKRRLKRGEHVRILAGAFKGHLAIYASMSAHEWVAVLLQILGGQQRVTLAQRDVEAMIC
jgi:transcription antitermination factor NusG